jgi:hypothetical protein
LVDKDVKNGFRGFVSNRFGRRAALSIEYLKMQASLLLLHARTS